MLLKSWQINPDSSSGYNFGTGGPRARARARDDPVSGLIVFRDCDRFQFGPIDLSETETETETNRTESKRSRTSEDSKPGLIEKEWIAWTWNDSLRKRNEINAGHFYLMQAMNFQECSLWEVNQLELMYFCSTS